MFDLSIGKILVLGVIALVLFGPDQLPKIAAQAGRALRDLRRLADSAKADLQEGLGPEFSDFDIADLNPKNFVRKHLFDDLDDLSESGPAHYAGDGAAGGAAAGGAAAGRSLPAGERPPYDPEAT
ncbi:MAG TPA: sec-independent translocase [Streptosporangiaceae bacterium]|nr:sec-independent translocase [Streptosporangiaceae bacterium]